MQLPIRYQADYLFACSDKAGEWLYGKNAVHKANYMMIPNGIDLARFAFDETKRKEMREKLQITDEEYVIGHVGRFTEPKNHKFLVEIFVQFHKSNPHSRLLMVGDGELFETVKAQCKELGVAGAVIMPGNCSNTEDYYQAMDIFVFPSLWEGLPVSVVEAQANGLQCLISDVITHDVDLTDQVHYFPLNEKEVWLEEIATVQKKKRTAVTKENQLKLQLFDAVAVAKKLQDFYLDQDERTRK